MEVAVVKKKTGSISFMNEAEAILRKAIEGNENFVVWRGAHPHVVGWGDYKRTLVREAIIAGMPDSSDPYGAPTITVVKVYLDDGSANIQFNAGTSEDFSQSTPFGGGHNPIDGVKEAAEKLSRVFS